MPKQAECVWTRQVCKQLVALGAIIKVEHGGSRFQSAGWPDRYICHTVWCGFLEFKGEKTIVTDLQRERMRELWVRQPGSVWIVRYPNLLMHYTEANHFHWNTPESLLLRLAEVSDCYVDTGTKRVAIEALQARMNK